MRIAVFGASGRTGRLVVARGSERGHDVTAVVRSRPDEPIRAAHTLVVDLGDRRSVASGVRGAEAVAWTIGPIVGVAGTDVSDAMRTAIEALGDAGVRRIVATANATVLTDREVAGEYANVTAEHRRNLAALRASDLDWTVLAPPFLTDDAPTGEIEAVIDGRAAGRSLTRGDFAAALVDALERSDWVGHAIGVANR